MSESLNVLVIIAMGLLVGNELAVAAFVHPTLNRLPDSIHLPVASALARLLGKVMPLWYISVFLLTSTAGWIRWHQTGQFPVWFAASIILMVLAIVYSVAVEVPINNRVAAWTMDTLPADWKIFRDKWDVHHRWRVGLLTISFALLVAGVVH